MDVPSLSINEADNDHGQRQREQPAKGLVLPPGVYIDAEEGDGDEKGETVSLALNRLGLFDVYFATEAQAFNSSDYSPLLEGRLSREEFVDFISRLNQVRPVPLSYLILFCIIYYSYVVFIIMHCYFFLKNKSWEIINEDGGAGHKRASGRTGEEGMDLRHAGVDSIVGASIAVARV
jgi:hypothetical protein